MTSLISHTRTHTPFGVFPSSLARGQRSVPSHDSLITQRSRVKTLFFFFFKSVLLFLFFLFLRGFAPNRTHSRKAPINTLQNQRHFFTSHFHIYSPKQINGHSALSEACRHMKQRPSSGGSAGGFKQRVKCAVSGKFRVKDLRRNCVCACVHVFVCARVFW